MKFSSPGQAIDWLHSRRYAGEKNGLTNTRALLSWLGNPERSFRCAHIAGTNGKGSTAAMLESMLRALGFRTGLYTSPYLVTYHERVRVAGAAIPDAALVEGTSLLWDACAELDRQGIFPTTFELGTALAFWYFQKCGVEIAVVEVGLGGRLDSTNVLTPDVSLIAAIAMDHMALLGDTLSKIAREKAGIIKPGVPVCVQRQSAAVLEVFSEVARACKSPISIAEPPVPLEITARYNRFFLPGWGEVCVPLPGRHQLINASLALHGLSALLGWTGIPDGQRLLRVQKGLKDTVWPGRLEWFGEDLLLDGAHNPQGARALVSYLDEHFPGEKFTLVTCMMRDKQIAECARIFAPAFERIVCTRVDEPRAADPAEIAREYAALGKDVATARTPLQALALARGRTVVAGSLYLVGAVRNHLAGASKPSGTPHDATREHTEVC